MQLILTSSEIDQLSPQALLIYEHLKAGSELVAYIDNDRWSLHRETGEIDEDDGVLLDPVIKDGDGSYGGGLLDALTEILGIGIEAV